MSNQRSVGKFCSVVVTNPTGASDSIAALNGSLLGEGAEAFCSSNAKAYRWTSAAVTAFSPVFIAATTGGGTWIMQGPGAYLSCAAVGSAAFTAAGTGGTPTLGLNVWSEFKTGAGFYTTVSGFGGNIATVNSTTGLILIDGSVATYRNVPFLITMQFSVTASASGNVWEFDLTQASGGNVGTTNQSQTAAQTTVTNAGANSISLSRLFLPTPGIGYEPVFRNLSSGATTLYAAFYQVSIVPAGIY